MATADIHDMSVPPETPDEIQQEYQDCLSAIAALELESAFWEQFNKSPYPKAFMEKMEHESNAKAINWRDPGFKPKDFAMEQARVIAIDTVLGEFKNYGADRREELSSQRRLKATLEDQYPLLLVVNGTTREQLDMIDSDIERHEGQETDAAAPGEGLITVTTMALNPTDDIVLIDRLKLAGFDLTETSADGQEMTWAAHPNKTATKLIRTIGEDKRVLEIRA